VTPTEAFAVMVAPGVALIIAGTAALVARAFGGGPSRTAYRVMALGIGLVPLSVALWFLVAAPQPWWVKVVGALASGLASTPALLKARQPPDSVA
jgi:hypothetical protein